MGAQFVQIDAQPERSVVDADEFAVAEETVLDSVDEFFGVDGEELPFADLLNGCDLSGAKTYFVILADSQSVVFVEIIEGRHTGYDNKDDGHQCDAHGPCHVFHKALKIIIVLFHIRWN